MANSKTTRKYGYLNTTLQKLHQVLEVGLKPFIMVSHAKPEDALWNIIKRFYEEGRGASINGMSGIQGGLHGTLSPVRDQLGHKVEFVVQDNRNRQDPQTLSGWNHLLILESEGNRTGDRFLCLHCKHSGAADQVAALNLLARASDSEIQCWILPSQVKTILQEGFKRRLEASEAAKAAGVVTVAGKTSNVASVLTRTPRGSKKPHSGRVVK